MASLVNSATTEAAPATAPGKPSPAPEKASPAPGKPSPRRTSNMSQASAVSSRQSFASEYSYHDSEGETPLKPVYNEETALAAALKESEQEEAFDRIAKQLEQSKIEEEGEAEEAPADDVASEAGSDAADPIPSRLPPDAREAWAEVPMILAAGGIARRRVDAWFRRLDVTPKIYAQVAGNEAIVSMVSLGLGLGVVPKIVLDNSPHAERVRVLEVDPVLEPYELGLFTLKRHLHNPLVDAFWSLLPDEVDQ